MGIFTGQITDAVLAVVEDQGTKKLQLTGRLSGQGTVNNQQAALPQPVDVIGFLVPEDQAGAPAGAGRAGRRAVHRGPAGPGRAGPPGHAHPERDAGRGRHPGPRRGQLPGAPAADPGGPHPRPAGPGGDPRRPAADISAIRGAGNLLGNLLCAVVNLLNGVNLAGLLSALPALAGQAGQLSQLLGSLSGSLNDLVAAINGLLGGAAP